MIAPGSLERALLLGLGWIAEQQHEFAVPDLADGPLDKDDVARLKPLSELTLTIWVLRRNGVRMAFLDDAAAWIWAETANGAAILRLLLARPDFVPACAIYAMLAELGFHSESLSTAIRHVARLALTAALPLPPWARLALGYNLARLGHRDVVLLGHEGLYVSARPEPWVVSGELGYAITHETFYLSDFGFERGIEGATLEYLRTWLPYWTTAFTAEGDWDLVGEMCMASLCVGLAAPPGLAAVVAAQDADGSIRGPDGAGSFLFTRTDSDDRRRFLGRYHTTLVFVMAAAMALARSVGSRSTMPTGSLRRPIEGRPRT